MTLPTRIRQILERSRVPFESEQIHYALKSEGETITLHLVRDTLNLMAGRGEVKQLDDGEWALPDPAPVSVKPKQGSLFV